MDILEFCSFTKEGIKNIKKDILTVENNELTYNLAIVENKIKESAKDTDLADVSYPGDYVLDFQIIVGNSTWFEINGTLSVK